MILLPHSIYTIIHFLIILFFHLTSNFFNFTALDQSSENSIGEWKSSGELVRTYLEVKQMLTLSPKANDTEKSVFLARLQQQDYLNNIRTKLDELTRTLGGK